MDPRSTWPHLALAVRASAGTPSNVEVDAVHGEAFLLKKAPHVSFRVGSESLVLVRFEFDGVNLLDPYPVLLDPTLDSPLALTSFSHIRLLS